MGCPRRTSYIRTYYTERTWDAAFGVASADRRGSRVLTVELPNELTGPQSGRRAFCWVLDHFEGVGGNPRRRGAVGAGLCRCRPAAGCAEPYLREAIGHFRIFDPSSCCATGHFYRFSPRWKAFVLSCGRAHEAGNHGV